MRHPDKFFRNLCMTIIVLLALYVVYAARDLLAPVLCGLLLAYIVYPLINQATSIGIPKGLSIFLIFIVMSLLVVYSIYKLVPLAKQEINVFTSADQSDVDNIENSEVVRIGERISQQLYEYKLIDQMWEPGEIIVTLKGWINEQAKALEYDRLGKVLGGAAKQTLQFVVIFLFVFIFALLDGDKFYRTLVQLIPNSIFEPGVFILKKTTDLFGYYLRGLVIENLILGIIAFVLMAGMTYFTDKMTLGLSLIIALIIALTNAIRIVGPWIGGALGVALILVYNADIAVMAGIIAVVVIVQTLDNVAVLPLVMQDQVDIHPVLCLLSVLAGGILAGILGMMLAIPISGAIKVVYQILTVEMKKFNMDPE